MGQNVHFCNFPWERVFYRKLPYGIWCPKKRVPPLTDSENSRWPLSRQCEMPWRFAVLLPMLSVTHIMPVLVLLSVVVVGMQQYMITNQNEMHKLSKVKNGRKYAGINKQFLPTFPLQDFFPVTSLTFSKIPDISLTAVNITKLVGFRNKWSPCIW